MFCISIVSHHPTHRIFQRLKQKLTVRAIDFPFLWCAFFFFPSGQPFLFISLSGICNLYQTRLYHPSLTCLSESTNGLNTSPREEWFSVESKIQAPKLNCVPSGDADFPWEYGSQTAL